MVTGRRPTPGKKKNTQASGVEWVTEECWCGCTVLYPSTGYWHEDTRVVAHCPLHDPESTETQRRAHQKELNERHVKSFGRPMRVVKEAVLGLNKAKHKEAK